MTSGLAEELHVLRARRRVLRVGYPAEAESDASGVVLTADSPLGVALIGRRAGDRITYPTPGGLQVADVVAVQLPTAGPLL